MSISPNGMLTDSSPSSILSERKKDIIQTSISEIKSSSQSNLQEKPIAPSMLDQISTLITSIFTIPIDQSNQKESEEKFKSAITTSIQNIINILPSEPSKTQETPIIPEKQKTVNEICRQNAFSITKKMRNKSAKNLLYQPKQKYKPNTNKLIESNRSFDKLKKNPYYSERYKYSSKTNYYKNNNFKNKKIEVLNKNSKIDKNDIEDVLSSNLNTSTIKSNSNTNNNMNHSMIELNSNSLKKKIITSKLNTNKSTSRIEKQKTAKPSSKSITVNAKRDKIDLKSPKNKDKDNLINKSTNNNNNINNINNINVNNANNSSDKKVLSSANKHNTSVDMPKSRYLYFNYQTEEEGRIVATNIIDPKTLKSKGEVNRADGKKIEKKNDPTTLNVVKVLNQNVPKKSAYSNYLLSKSKGLVDAYLQESSGKSKNKNNKK